MRAITVMKRARWISKGLPRIFDLDFDVKSGSI